MKIKLVFFKRLFTVFLTSYLMNIFYFNGLVRVQQLLLWTSILLYLLLNWKIVETIINRNILTYISKKNVCILLALWGIIIIITPPLHGTTDFSYFRDYLSVIASILSYSVICVRIYKTENGNRIAEKFMQYYVYGMAIYIFSTIFAITIESYRNFILNHVSMSEYALQVIQDPRYRTRIGFAGLSVYASGIKCAFANIFTLYFAYKNIREHKRNKMGLAILYLLTLLGEFFYSRTSLMVSVILLFVFVFFVLVSLHRLGKFLKYVLIAVIGILTAALYIGQFEGDSASMRWALEVYINLASGRGFSATSLNIMKRMAFTPSMSTLLVGDGYYTDPGTGFYYRSVDLGYLRSILYYGLTGFLFAVLLIASTLHSISKVGKTKEYKLISLMLFFSMLVFEIKGEGMPIYYPILFALLICVSKPEEPIPYHEEKLPDGTADREEEEPPDIPGDGWDELAENTLCDPEEI